MLLTISLQMSPANLPLNWIRLQVKLSSIQSAHMWITPGNKGSKITEALAHKQLEGQASPMKQCAWQTSRIIPSNQIKVCTLQAAPLDNCCQICLPSVVTYLEHVQLTALMQANIILHTRYLYCWFSWLCVLPQFPVWLVKPPKWMRNSIRKNRDQQRSGSPRKHMKPRRDMRSLEMASSKCDCRYLWEHILRWCYRSFQSEESRSYDGDVPLSPSKYWLEAWAAATARHFSHSG